MAKHLLLLRILLALGLLALATQHGASAEDSTPGLVSVFSEPLEQCILDAMDAAFANDPALLEAHNNNDRNLRGDRELHHCSSSCNWKCRYYPYHQCWEWGCVGCRRRQLGKDEQQKPSEQLVTAHRELTTSVCPNKDVIWTKAKGAALSSLVGCGITKNGRQEAIEALLNAAHPHCLVAYGA